MKKDNFLSIRLSKENHISHKGNAKKVTFELILNLPDITELVKLLLEKIKLLI